MDDLLLFSIVGSAVRTIQVRRRLQSVRINNYEAQVRLYEPCSRYAQQTLLHHPPKDIALHSLADARIPKVSSGIGRGQRDK